jgi:hypothetical protein
MQQQNDIDCISTKMTSFGLVLLPGPRFSIKTTKINRSLCQDIEGRRQGEGFKHRLSADCLCFSACHLSYHGSRSGIKP